MADVHNGKRRRGHEEEEEQHVMKKQVEIYFKNAINFYKFISGSRRIVDSNCTKMVRRLILSLK
jgi:hypothetical protein